MKWFKKIKRKVLEKLLEEYLSSYKKINGIIEEAYKNEQMGIWEKARREKYKLEKKVYKTLNLLNDEEKIDNLEQCIRYLSNPKKQPIYIV